QDQRRNACAPGSGGKPPAARIEHGRRAEVRHAIARCDAWPHRPERRGSAARPAQERDAVPDGPALPLQPTAGRGCIGHTLTITANLALAHGALRAKPARREAVDEKNCKALSREALAPVGKTPHDLAVWAQEPGASMQAHDHREGPRALRPVEDRVQGSIAFTNVNDFSRRRRSGGRNESEGSKSEAHSATVPW